MEVPLSILALMLSVGVLYAFFSLQREVHALRRRLDHLVRQQRGDAEQRGETQQRGDESADREQQPTESQPAEPLPAEPPPPVLPKPVPDRIDPESWLPEPAPVATEPDSAGARVGLEERVGGSLAVWAGAVALALAGVFLVKHFVEQGLLGPGPRVALASLFGFALLGLAAWLRPRFAEIAQGLAAAGVAVLSGAVYSATALYGFLSPLSGTLVQGLVTALAIAASLRFGSFVAVLGQFGGFVIPAVIGPGAIGPGAMFSYLALLQIALALVGRSRGWWWVTVLGAAGSFVWAIAWPFLRGDGLVVTSLFALASAAIAIGSTRGVDARPGRDSATVEEIVPWVALGAALWVLLHDLSRSGFAPEQWGFVGVLGIGSLVLAAKDRRLAGLPWAFTVAVGLMLFDEVHRQRSRVVPVVDDVQAAATLGFALVIVFGGLCAASSRRGNRAVLSWLPPAGLLIATVAARRGGLDTLAASVVFSGITSVLALRIPGAGTQSPETEPRTDVRELALWITALIGLSNVIDTGLGVPYRAVGFAGVPVLFGLIALRRGLRVPESIVPAALIATSVVILHDRLVVGRELQTLFVGPTPLGALALTAACFASASIVHRASSGMLVARRLQQLGILALSGLLLVWVTSWFRHFPSHGGSYTIASVLSVVWIVSGLALERTSPRWSMSLDPSGRPSPHGLGLAYAGTLTLGLFSCWFLNPVVVKTSVGELPILNDLLLGYGLGGVLALIVCQRFRLRNARVPTRVAGFVAFACGFLLVTLQTRHLFAGDPMYGSITGRPEYYSYSAVWLVYGAVLLAVGVRRDLRVLRLAALLVVLVAVLKVFLLDANQLDGLLRVLSFFGLGSSLIALAWVYQKTLLSNRV